MIITVLGAGCANCNRLEANVNEALKDTGIDATVTHITDYAEIAAHGVMATPALAIDNRVVVGGRVPSVAEVKELLQATFM